MTGTVAIVAAAGSSRRMGGVKKEFRVLEGVPVLVSAIRPLLAEPRCSRVIVMLPEESLAEAEGILEPHLALDRLEMLAGGASRQESVWRGLVALAGEPPEIVLIHDGARPWLSAPLVSRVLEGAIRWGACVPAVEAHEAVKEVGGDSIIVRHIPRATIRLAQTPQGFRYSRILEAHERARRAGLAFVDDAEVYARFEGPVAWVEGDPANAKITWPADMERA